MFGDCLIATTARGICNLYFLDEMDDRDAALMLREEWSIAEIISDRQITQPISDRLFSNLPNLIYSCYAEVADTLTPSPSPIKGEGNQKN